MFLYHKVPSGLKGAEILPLSYLKRVYLAKYQEEMKKYEGRDWLAKFPIPMLKCGWHECIQFSIVPPAVIKQEMEAVDLTFGGEFFEIDAAAIPKAHATVFLYENDIEVDKPWNDLEFVPFDPSYFTDYTWIGSDTRVHYSQCALHERTPMPWYRTPHVLVNVPVSIKGVRRFKV